MKSDITSPLANALTRGRVRHIVILLRRVHWRCEGNHDRLTRGGSGRARNPLNGERDDGGIAFPAGDGDTHALGSLSLAFGDLVFE
jgi:hypothetical protein